MTGGGGSKLHVTSMTLNLLDIGRLPNSVVKMNNGYKKQGLGASPEIVRVGIKETM